MKKSFILVNFFVCLTISYDAIFQDKEYEPGYYVTQNGDTIKGYFWTKDQNKLSNLKMKKEVNETISTDLSFDTCQSLLIKNRFYVSWYGKRCMAYVSKFDFDLKYIDSFLTQTIPLRLLYQGSILSLFLYRSDVKDHFFVKKGNSIAELIISYRYRTDLEKFTESHTRNPATYYVVPAYQNQLSAYLGDKLTKKLKDNIESCDYDEVALIRLFKRLNK